MAEPQGPAWLGCVGGIVFVVFAGLIMADSCKPDPQREAELASDMKIIIAQDRIREKLRDPDSAVFSDVRVSSRFEGVVCGRVNSRNGFGGMSGPQRFITSAAISGFEEDFKPGEFNDTWNKMC